MRYYRVEISDPTSGKLLRVFASQVNGQDDPGALNIELDLYVTTMATPLGNAYVRIWGVSLQDIGQGSVFNNKTIKVFGGMSAGLPLAKPAQAGLLVQGVVWQSFGNWQDTNQSLDLLLISGTGSPTAPANISFNWKAGMPLASALATTLAVAFPGFSQSINISPRLVLNHDEPGYYQSLPQFAQYVREVSQSIIGSSTYTGVEITLKQQALIVYDGTTPSTPKLISFEDLVGQPTWLAPGMIQAKMVMRADLSVSDYIKLPPGQYTTTAASYSQYRDTSVQQGVYQVDQVRHVGSFRQGDGNSWVSIYNCHPVSNG